MNLLKIKNYLFLLLILSIFSCVRKPEETKTQLIVWHWMTDREPVFIELAKKYENQFGTKIKFELYAPSEVYSQKIRASAQTDTLPDIYGILGETRDFASFILSGYVEDLTPYMKENDAVWEKRFFKKALDVCKFEPGNQFGVKEGIYAVPIDMMSIQMLYNKDLFRQAGLDPEKPLQTWKEFVDVCRKLKSANIPRLVSGFGEIWLIDCLANNFTFNILGEKKFFDTLKGKVPYTDPDWIKVFSIFDEIRKEEIIIKDSITMTNKVAEQTFANNRAAFAFNGSWCVNVYRGMNPDLNYGVMLPPKVSDKFPMKVWGGAGSFFVVNAKTKNKEEAIKFLKWLTEKEQQVYLVKETLNLPSVKDAVEEVHPILQQFAKGLDQATHPRVWPLQEFPEVIEAFNKGIQSIIIGEKTPSQVAQEVQKIKSEKMRI